ncbi:MAG TPA: DEAD/DEAH box helicase [Ktedonobacteraceae bacterium]
MPSFNDFSLQSTTLALLANMNIVEPTPIQAQAIPALMAGSDLVGQSATGSGKTLAYSIPLVERLANNKRVVQALVLVPTRELATQVNAVLSKLATTRRMTTALLVGGKAYGKQISSLRYGAQIVVGTPGRVKDLLEHGSLSLNQIRICVLDEADQMLDIGFAPVVEEILATTPETRQTALFSATMPDWVAKLEQKFLKQPVKVSITPAMGGQSTIEQIAYQVPQAQKMAALCTLLHSAAGESTLIFGRTKFGVEKLGQQLSKLGFTVGTLHGNKSQYAREEVLAAFRRGQVQTLLATNVAARGLDIQGIYQVINYELPESSELFTHRVGRTGRMGRQGKAITLLAPADISKWRRMARSLGQEVLLQKLAIDENAAIIPVRVQAEAPATRKNALAETPASQPRESERERRVERVRKPVSPALEHVQHDEPEATRKPRPFTPDADQEMYRVQWPARDRQAGAAEQTDEPHREYRPARSRKPFSPDQSHTSLREGRPPRGLRPVSTEREYEQYGEYRPSRSRGGFSPDQAHEPSREGRPARALRPVSTEHEHQQYGEYRPARSRRPSSFETERGGFARPGSGYERRPAPAAPQRRAPEGSISSRPERPSTWQGEEFVMPERPAAGQSGRPRKGPGKPASFEKAVSKRKAFVTPEGSHETSGKRPAAPARKAAGARRSAGR